MDVTVTLQSQKTGKHKTPQSKTGNTYIRDGTVETCELVDDRQNIKLSVSDERNVVFFQLKCNKNKVNSKEMEKGSKIVLLFNIKTDA